tara:strand:- start:2480 stop:3199 length:720 start_codon:yes stop_codon:yes gene_type:complete
MDRSESLYESLKSRFNKSSNNQSYVIAIIIIIIVSYFLYSQTSDKEDDGEKDANKCDGTPFTKNTIEDLKNKKKSVNSPECYKESKCDIILNNPGELKDSYRGVLGQVVTEDDTDEIKVFKYNCSKCLQGSDNDPVIKKLSNLSNKDSEFAMKMCDAKLVGCTNPTLYALRNINWDNECKSDLSDGVDSFFCTLLKNGVIQFILNIIPDFCSLKILEESFVHGTKCSVPEASHLFDECK